MEPLITRRAPAKVNLGLEIVGRRADGYHDLVTIFQAVDIVDEVTIAPAPPSNLTLAADPRLGGDANLALRAARALADAIGTTQGAALTLTKHIPVAAGLGGGSSDAAATLLALRELWALDIADADLAQLAARLGADVPFFLRGGTALATGIGEILTPLAALPQTWFVLLTPTLPLPADKTRQLYRALTPADFSDGSRTRAQADRLRRGESLDPDLLVNTFATPLYHLFPTLTTWRDRLLAAGAPWVLPSGSGPTLFTIASTADAAQEIASACISEEAQIAVVREHP